MDLRVLLQESLNAARAVRIVGNSKREVHAARSREWVEALAAHLSELLGGDQAIRVFSKHNYEHRAEFGLNELLYDVVACRVGTVRAPVHRETLLCYVEEVLWQIESEFAKNTRHALADFNKLVLGSARNKLFVGPQVHDNRAFIKTLLPAARACTGNVYLALIPHPAQWEQADYRIDVWACLNGQWEVLKEG
jgi:hypothetical protein